MHASVDAQAHNARRPEQTLLYRTLVEQFETWLELARSGQFDGQGEGCRAGGHRH